MPKVLISEQLSKQALDVFLKNGVEADYKPNWGKDPNQLIKYIKSYDGLVVRSATLVTDQLISKASKLQVIGRAGIGVDNIDVAAASKHGVVVMNTPYGNSITTAEHAIAMLLAVARQIPQAHISTATGKWEKTKFIGIEVTGKTLGLIGAGNIGSIVANRAIGLKMRVLAFDPFLSEDLAKQIGVKKIDDISELLSISDFVSLHIPKTEKTRNLISWERVQEMKQGAVLINCARGGLVDESAVAEALKKGRLAGAAFDVFEEEPAISNPLFLCPTAVFTPHLGAATSEAQEKVAVQIAQQMSIYLRKGSIENALNAPSITAEEAPVLTPWIDLVKALGSFVGQVTETAIRQVEIEYVGIVADLNLKPLTSALVAELLRPLVEAGTVNMVSAPLIARQRGIKISEVKRDAQGVFGSYVKLTLSTETITRSIAGTVYSDGKPRFIQIKGINMEAEPQQYMIYTSNSDSPGYIGALGTELGNYNLNIATFSLGRDKKSGEAIALLGLDEQVEDTVLDKIRALPQVLQAKALQFK